MPTDTTIQSHTRNLGWGISFFAVAALLIPHPAWMIFLVCLGGAWGMSYVWVRALVKGISAERHLRSNWIAIGDVLIEQFEIRNRSRFPAPYIEIADQSNMPSYRPAFVVAMNGNRAHKWRQAAICSQRGRYQLGPWSLRFSDPFGLYAVTFIYTEQREIVIHPPTLPTLPIPLPVGMRDGGQVRQQSGWQAQLNAAGVRHYRPGDPLRQIHWLTSARHNTLFVREFEQDAGGEVWLLLDMAACNQIGKGRTTSEEQSILLAATVAERVLRQRHAVGLAAYGQTPHLIRPGHGTQQQWRLLESLATLTADGTLDLAGGLRDLRRMVKRGAALLVMTAADSAEWLPTLIEYQQAGVAVSVALFDRASYGATGDSSSVQRELQQRGILCTRIRPDELYIRKPKQQLVWQALEQLS